MTAGEAIMSPQGKAGDRKVAIITGASRGIGASLASGFSALGYGVVVNARSKIAGSDPDIVAVEGDIARADTAERIVGAALDRFGRIDTLVNNAGLFIPRPFTDYSDADFAAMTGVNLAGFFHLTTR